MCLTSFHLPFIFSSFIFFRFPWPLRNRKDYNSRNLRIYPPNASDFSYLTYRQALSFTDVSKVRKGWTFIRKGRVTFQGSMFEIASQDNPQTISTCLLKTLPSCILKEERDFLWRSPERPRLTQGLLPSVKTPKGGANTTLNLLTGAIHDPRLKLRMLKHISR